METQQQDAAAIKAGLDRREALARAVDWPDWYGSDGVNAVTTGAAKYVACGPWEGDMDEDDVAHIAANDPAHVLAVLAAAREELAVAVAQQERHAPYRTDADVYCNDQRGCGQDYPCSDAQQAARTLARLVALYGPEV